MSIITTSDGTKIVVPRKVQGIISNEVRRLEDSLRHVEQEHKYVLRFIEREQKLASTKLKIFQKKLKADTYVSPTMERVTEGSTSNCIQQILPSEDRLRRLPTASPLSTGHALDVSPKVLHNSKKK